MPAKDILTELASDLERSVRLTSTSTRIWVYKSKAAVIDFSIEGLDFALDLTTDQGALTASVLGRSDEGREILKNAFTDRYEMLAMGGGRHIMGRLKDAYEFPEAAAEQCYQWILETRRLVSAQTHAGTELTV
ncbi:hypothetical protein QMA10_10105 [Arthrobacter sp. APC 3897]|uniref:hypothetical protein n=1 Tax=Arthrobacter sp. APC 3897 TaxID=3035204 RepID=UPI0025B3B2E8|nr:hypothetical protein [Arthrobacter sp. APC 3897]MDN3482270.1 hypothetical protein [Arthrobacter sp. APC 3897]